MGRNLMSHKDLREQFIEHLVTKNYVEAEKLQLLDAKNKIFELTELQHTFDRESVSVMEYLCLHYHENQPLDNAQDVALLKIILNFGRKEYSKNTTPLIFVLSAEFVLAHGTVLAEKLLKAGAAINESRAGQYKPLAVICNEIESNPALKDKYNGIICELLQPEVEDLELNEKCFFHSDQLTALKNDGLAKLAKKRLQPLWVRLVNLGYREQIGNYYAKESQRFHQHVVSRKYVEAMNELNETLALSDVLINNANSVSEYVFSCLPRLDDKKVEEAAEFLAVVAKASAEVTPRFTITNNALDTIAKLNSDEVDDKLKNTYKTVVKTMLRKGCFLTKENRVHLTQLGISSHDLLRWGTKPPAGPPARSRAGTTRSRDSQESLHKSRSMSVLADNPKLLAEALSNLDLQLVKNLIHRDHKLALRDLVFIGKQESLSPARYLAKRYPDCNPTQQKTICELILDINNVVNSLSSLDDRPKDEIFASVLEMITKLSERDPQYKAQTQSLFDFIQAQTKTIDKSTVSSDESEASPVDQKSEKDAKADEADLELTNVVRNTIQECLKKFDDDTFDREQALIALTRDTMQYAKAVSFDELADIIRKIEETIVDPKDPQWRYLREVVGEIVNQTADHYIAENKRVTDTFKKTLWLCLTIIGALVPLIYYFVKVKPTREASPLVVYEMTRNAFDEITSKVLTEEQKTPRGGNTTHRVVEKSTSYMRRLNKIDQEQPRLISHKCEDKANGHLKRCTFFSNSDRKIFFNGSINQDSFATHGSKFEAEVRVISQKGLQADRFAEKIDDLDEQFQEQVVQVF